MKRAASSEDGQVVAFLAVGVLALLLGVAALVIDVGRAYVVKRQLQATADAAALAAADALPTVADAQAAAADYGAQGKNPVPGVTATESFQARCLHDVAYCYGGAAGTVVSTGKANGVVVTESASVPTMFAKVLGIDSLDVQAKATACGACASQPLDIALVIDRTASMKYAMENLKSGVRTFLQALDPKLDHVALFALPPSPSSDPCDSSFDATAAFPFDAHAAYAHGSETRYLVAGLSSDYQTSTGAINESSQLVQNLSCLPWGGPTAYKQALMVAHDYLAANGRAGVQKVIVFESDGAANIAPDDWYDKYSNSYETSKSQNTDGTVVVKKVTLYNAASGHADDINRPCGSAVDYANSIKQPTPADPHGYMVFTLYFANNDNTCFPSPHRTGIGYRDPDVPEGTASNALTAMAAPNDLLQASDPNALPAAFAALANGVLGATLVPDEPAS